jgi:predicted AlkP superfamily phosphohydrolase/phosphomutase
MAAKIIAIALEAAEPDLIEKWCDEGHLPTLDALRKKGVWSRVRTPNEISSGATWPTMITGTNPGKHGIGFYHRQIQTGTYDLVKKYADQVKRDPFWNKPAEAGKRIVVFDVPATRPVEGFNGVHLTGWGAEAPIWPKSSWPPGLMEELSDRFGRHRREGWYQVKLETEKDCREFMSDMVDGAGRKCDIAGEILSREDWDLFLVSFSESHMAGHHLWHLMDEHHPEYRPEKARAAGGGILDVYRELDRVVAILLEACPDSTVIVFSNTGMGPNYSGNHLLPEILDRLGMGAGTQDKATPGGPVKRVLPAGRWGPYAVKKVEAILSPALITAVKRWVPLRSWDVWTRWFLGLGSDWKTRKAFSVPSDYSGSIRFNLKGREPNGRIEPGAEYDALCDRLIEDLSALVNPETGKEAVRSVYRVDRVYQGENLRDLPDLIVQWTGDAPIRALTSPKIGTVRGLLPDKRSGAHRTYGFLSLSGKYIKPSATVPEADLMDLAPTILHLMGEPVPADLDGRILLDAIDDRQRAEQAAIFRN